LIHFYKSLSSVSSRPLGGGEVVRGRGRALPPNLLASHNLLTASHNYHKEELPQNLLAAHNGYLNPSNQPSHKTYYGVNNIHSFYDSQADDKDHFPANPLFKHKPHQKENFPSHKSEFGDAENSFSLTLPHFFKEHAEPQPSAISSKFQWSPIGLGARRKRLIDRAGWETEKKSWSEGGRRADEAEGPPFGEILERFGRKQRVKEERRIGRGGNGWKPLSENSWSTTPNIWTNEVESPVITIDNYKSYLNDGIGGGGGGQFQDKKRFKKNFEKVVKGSIRVSADHNSPSHLIIDRP